MKRRLCSIFAAASIGFAVACTPVTAPLANNNMNRMLTDGEIALAQQIFGDQIDYSRVRVYQRNSGDRSRVHRNNIYFGADDYREDFAQSQNVSARSVYIHEMAHIWQHQNGTNLVDEAISLFFRHGGNYDASYDYDNHDLRRFAHLGIEQQAAIIEDYFYFNEIAATWNRPITCPQALERAQAIESVFPDLPINPVCARP